MGVTRIDGCQDAVFSDITYCDPILDEYLIRFGAD